MKKSAVIVHSTSTQSDGSMPRLCILRIGGMPWRMFISIGKAIETCAPTSLTFCQPMSDIPVMWMNRLSGPIPIVAVGRRVPALASSSKIGRMPNGERMCAAIWRPSWRPIVQDWSVVGVAEIDLAAHDHVDELVGRGEPLFLMRVASCGYAYPGVPRRRPRRRSRNSRRRRGAPCRSAPGWRRPSAAASDGSARRRAPW